MYLRDRPFQDAVDIFHLHIHTPMSGNGFHASGRKSTLKRLQRLMDG
jgi:hypothetical protein